MRVWKILMFFPLLMLVSSIGLLINNLYTRGELLERDIELTGGKLITFEVSDITDIKTLENELGAHIRYTSGLRNLLLIEVPFDSNESRIIDVVKENINVIGEPSIRSIGPVMSEIFWQQTQIALIMAFIFMAILVFILFRTFVPSLAVILAAITDIFVTMAFMDFIGLKLSLATLAGLLMLIGYSVDTDILLTSRLLKTRVSEISERIKSAIKTGMTMQLTTITAVACLYFTIDSIIIKQIALVLLIGLSVDIVSTWLGNAGILRWYVERKEK